MKHAIVISVLAAFLLPACATPATPAAAPAPPAATAGPASTPNNAALPHIEAARKALQTRDFAMAVSEAQKAVAADPGAAQAFYTLGNALNQQSATETDSNRRNQLLDLAVDAYQKTLAINANSAETHHNLGTVYLQREKLPEARQQFEAALKIEPNDPKSHYMLGTIFLQDDPASAPESLKRAQGEFETALKLDANLAEAHIGLAQIYLSQGAAAQALESAKKGVAMSGANVDPFSYWQLAQAQCAAGDKAGATQTLARVDAANIADPGFNEQVRALKARCK
jgi:Tfp pilus assembly protein PilF